MEPLALTFDLGTQSLRAVLVDPTGSIVSYVQKKFERTYVSPKPGQAEQDADFFWYAIVSASRELKEKSGADWERVVCVSLTTVRDSIVLIDKDGVPVRPLILWLDKRETEMPPLSFKDRAIFAAVGMTKAVELTRKISAVNYLRHCEPENFARADKVVFLSTYLNMKLCGHVVDSTASVIGHLPYDNKNRRWLTPRDQNYVIFPVEGEKLADLVEPGEVMGKITSQCARETGIKEGLPLIATGSDKACETLGLSCTTPEKAAVSFGTTATISYTIDRYVEPQRFFPAYASPIRGHYHPEIQIYRGYWLISWFKKEFAEKEVKEALKLGVSAEDLLNRRLKEIPPGSNGLVFQPYFTPNFSMPNTRGAVIGFSEVTTRIHLYRAIIEGINFALMEGAFSLEKKMKTKTEGIYVAGGGSRSHEICQITSDMFGLPLYRAQSHETGVIGSAAVAFQSVGVYETVEDGIDKMVHITETFTPDMKNHAVYMRLYNEVFEKIFKKLKPLYETAKVYE